MTTAELLRVAWDPDPTILAGCLALVAGWLVATRGRPGRTAWAFLTGVLVLLLSLVSPIDVLGDTVLFSLHMLQHLLLLLIVPPLLILGVPARVWARLLAWPPAATAERVLNQPAGAWVLAIGTLWVWHVPALYDAALYDPRIHLLEHLCFLVTAAIFWWPLVTPLAARRMPALGALVYLLLASLVNSALGIVITFAPPGLYAPYAHPAAAPGLVHLVRDTWSISLGQDQQMGGALMWVLGNLPYLAALGGLLARWFEEPDDEAGLEPVARRSNAT